MEQYYYNHMDKQKQAAYHGILQELPAWQMNSRFRHWTEKIYTMFSFSSGWIIRRFSGRRDYKYRYYKDSPNIIFIPEYLFDKGKIKEHQKALKARVEKLARPAMKLSEWEKEKYVHDFICENIHYDKLKKSYSHEIIGPLGQGVGVCEGIAKSVKCFVMH